VKNLEAIDQTKWLADNLGQFSEEDRSMAANASFLPSGRQPKHKHTNRNTPTSSIGSQCGMLDTNTVDLIMRTMLDPELRQYFGPRRAKPSEGDV